MRISDWSSDVCYSDLAPGISARSLHDRLATFAAGRASFRAPPLNVSAIGTFIALTFSEPAPEMRALADAAVQRLDALRAPLTPREIERRLQSRLSPRQEALLGRWGYPYVFDEFRFHMTRSEEHTSELQSLMRNSYAVFCLKKKN